MHFLRGYDLKPCRHVLEFRLSPRPTRSRYKFLALPRVGPRFIPSHVDTKSRSCTRTTTYPKTYKNPLEMEHIWIHLVRGKSRAELRRAPAGHCGNVPASTGARPLAGDVAGCGSAGAMAAAWSLTLGAGQERKLVPSRAIPSGPQRS